MSIPALSEDHSADVNYQIPAGKSCLGQQQEVRSEESEVLQGWNEPDVKNKVPSAIEYPWSVHPGAQCGSETVLIFSIQLMLLSGLRENTE